MQTWHQYLSIAYSFASQFAFWSLCLDHSTMIFLVYSWYTPLRPFLLGRTAFLSQEIIVPSKLLLNLGRD